MSGKVDRFQIMAVLQAARAYALGLELAAAKSWGLNRAIFYTLARKGYLQRRKEKLQNLNELDRARNKKWFMIGGKAQTPDLFDRQVKRRFSNWAKVWSEALEIVENTDEWNLTRQSRFYENVYKRHRDELLARWGSQETPQESKNPAASDTTEKRKTFRVIRGGRASKIPAA